MTRIGTSSQQLGLSYVGSNSHTGETVRRRVFTWSKGGGKALEDALTLSRSDSAKGAQALEDVKKRFAGTRAGLEAQFALEQRATVPTPSESDGKSDGDDNGGCAYTPPRQESR
jgi:hypothetical protein